MSKKGMLRSLVATVLMLAYVATASATVVVFAVRGVTDDGQEGNAWDINPGDFIDATGTFDDIVLTGGTGFVFLDTVGNSLNLAIGTQTYNASDDDAFGTGFPFLEFNRGQLVDLNFSTTSGGIQLMSSGGSVTGVDSLGLGFNATWDFSTYSVVPVPPAVWLFGSGLIGLIGIARRKKS